MLEGWSLTEQGAFNAKRSLETKHHITVAQFQMNVFIRTLRATTNHQFKIWRKELLFILRR